MTKLILSLRIFDGAFAEVAVSLDICKALFQCWLECEKLLSGGSSGGLREVPGGRKSLLEGSGGAPEVVKRFQKSLRDGKSCPRASKRDLEAVLGAKTAVGNFFWGGFWRPRAAFGEALGRLGATFSVI